MPKRRRIPADSTGGDTDNDATVRECHEPTREKRKRKRRKKKHVPNKTDANAKNEKNHSDPQDDEVGKSSVAAAAPPDPLPQFPFPTEPDDHCETPQSAYADIAPLLKRAAGKMNKDVSTIRIYDPYYCDNAVERNLGEMGFQNVYNKKEDCYKVWEDPNRCPQYDVLLTNPPYSGVHIEKLMRYVSSSEHGNRCWFLLLPNWVHKKPYFSTACASIRPFFIVPRKRYIYLPPTNFREARKSDVHKKSSPWPSMWYIWGGTAAMNETLIKEFYNNSRAEAACSLARTKSALRDLRRKARR